MQRYIGEEEEKDRDERNGRNDSRGWEIFGRVHRWRGNRPGWPIDRLAI